MEGSSSSDESSKISLRPLGLSDIDDLMLWVTDEKVQRFLPWKPNTSKEDEIQYIKDHVIPHPWFRAILLDNKPIGYIEVISSMDNWRRAELGYLLGSEYWGRGLATRAVKLVVNTIFKEWRSLERLEGLVDVDNVASQRVLEKAGFQKEGVLRKYFMLKGKTRDMVMFSLLSSR